MSLSFFRPAARVLAIAGLPFLIGARSSSHGAPVTLVSIPWATASVNGGDPFVIPSTVVLQPGEYRVVIQRQGYQSVERSIRVGDGRPQSHMVRLERR